MTTTYSSARAARNLDALDVAIRALTSDQQHSLTSVLLGSLAGYMDEDTWTDTLERARRFTEQETDGPPSGCLG